jgi:hypothetical protein
MFAYFNKARFVSALSTLEGRTLDPATVTLAGTVTAGPFLGSNKEVGRLCSYPSADGLSTLNRTVYYNRMDLAYLTTSVIPKLVQLTDGVMVYDLIPQLIQLTGIEFTTDDLVNAQVTAQSSSTSFTLTLTAKAGSPKFKGSCTLTVARKPALSTAFSTNSINWV